MMDMNIPPHKIVRDWPFYAPNSQIFLHSSFPGFSRVNLQICHSTSQVLLRWQFVRYFFISQLKEQVYCVVRWVSWWNDMWKMWWGYGAGWHVYSTGRNHNLAYANNFPMRIYLHAWRKFLNERHMYERASPYLRIIIITWYNNAHMLKKGSHEFIL